MSVGVHDYELLERHVEHVPYTMKKDNQPVTIGGLPGFLCQENA